jgi:hypothetical protein
MKPFVFSPKAVEQIHFGLTALYYATLIQKKTDAFSLISNFHGEFSLERFFGFNLNANCSMYLSTLAHDHTSPDISMMPCSLALLVPSAMARTSWCPKWLEAHGKTLKSRAHLAV